MSDFKAKMHQIRFRTQTPLGELTGMGRGLIRASIGPPPYFLGGSTPMVTRMTTNGAEIFYVCSMFILNRSKSDPGRCRTK